MANSKSKPVITRNMRLITNYIDTPGKPDALAGLIARHRRPGEDWLSWEELAVEIRDITGVLYTRESIRAWAKTYRIPMDTKKLSNSKDEIDRYNHLLKLAGVSTK